MATSEKETPIYLNFRFIGVIISFRFMITHSTL